MKTISLTQNKHALVDDSDYMYLMRWKWCYSHGYALRGSSPNRIYMHRLINKTPKGLDTDHINHDTLDNRRNNLRTVTHSENLRNSKLSKSNKSGHRGIYWDSERKKWRTSITENGKRILYKRFSTLDEAARAYDKFKESYH